MRSCDREGSVSAATGDPVPAGRLPAPALIFFRKWLYAKHFLLAKPSLTVRANVVSGRLTTHDRLLHILFSDKPPLKGGGL
jgi:hypothetical protein